MYGVIVQVIGSYAEVLNCTTFERFWVHLLSYSDPRVGDKFIGVIEFAGAGKKPALVGKIIRDDAELIEVGCVEGTRHPGSGART